jgi:hypothetical protein
LLKPSGKKSETLLLGRIPQEAPIHPNPNPKEPFAFSETIAKRPNANWIRGRRRGVMLLVRGFLGSEEGDEPFADKKMSGSLHLGRSGLYR